MRVKIVVVMKVFSKHCLSKNEVPSFKSNKLYSHKPDSFSFTGARLTTEEKELLAGLPKNIKPTNLIIFTDPGFDVDDETALLVSGALQNNGLVDVKAVIATTIPSRERALLAKGVFKELGLNNVPVAVGNNISPELFSPEPLRLKADFVANLSEVESNAQFLIKKTMKTAQDKSLTLLIIANMSDVATFLKENETLFKNKVKQIVIMGGVNQCSENDDKTANDIKLDTKKLMEANNIATNNRHHQESADYLYKKAQKLNIPLKVVTRKAATAIPINPDFFKDLAETGNPVAKHIQSIEGDYLNKFWQSAYNNKLGPGRDIKWFKDAFCKSDIPDTITDKDDIRPYLRSRVLYDAIALLACVDELSNQLFDPIKIKTKDTIHEVIGLSSNKTGLLNPQNIATLLSALAKNSLKE